MSAAPHFVDVPKGDRPRRVAPHSTRSLRHRRAEALIRDRPQDNLPPSSPSETAFSKAQELPFWLQFMFFLQHSSSLLAFSMIAITLAVYAWTVYIPKQWSKEFKKLETLQRYERQITATNETLKNQLAQQAERPEMGLARPNPNQSIFLTPASTPLPTQPTHSTTAKSQPPVIVTPLAY